MADEGFQEAPSSRTPIEHRSRILLIEELAERLSGRGTRRQRLTYWRKRLMWALVVGLARAAKRLADIVVSALALVLLSPLFLVVAVLIKATDPLGPVFFVQRRVGLWGREFPFPKFRSMVQGAEQAKDHLLGLNEHGEDGITFKMKDDPRVTRIGRFLRRFSIDELPQFWCVLRGDMSLVGPRPAVPREVAAYSLRERRRLEVRPGLTCIWQVSGRAEIAFDRQVELDQRYVDSRSLLLDLKLLFLTVPAILMGRGAY